MSIPKTLYEQVAGGNITLPCTFKSKLQAPRVVVISWTEKGTQPNAQEALVLTYFSVGFGITDIKSTYKGRVALDVDIETGRANLNLSSITVEENKIFECRVQIPGDDDGVPAAAARLVVLVPPSRPICKMEGEAVHGHDIKLTSHSEEGWPLPTYRWEVRDIRNLPKVPVATAVENNGVLSLFGITRDTSGYYICTSANKISSASCNITLAVMPQQPV